MAAVRDPRILYAVVQDNDRTLWKEYGVRGWPTAVRVHRRGTVRSPHVGEGDYRRTEAAIQRLVREQG